MQPPPVPKPLPAPRASGYGKLHPAENTPYGDAWASTVGLRLSDAYLSIDAHLGLNSIGVSLTGKSGNNSTTLDASLSLASLSATATLTNTTSVSSISSNSSYGSIGLDAWFLAAAVIFVSSGGTVSVPTPPSSSLVPVPA